MVNLVVADVHTLARTHTRLPVHAAMHARTPTRGQAPLPPSIYHGIQFFVRMLVLVQPRKCTMVYDVELGIPDSLRNGKSVVAALRRMLGPTRR